MKNGLHKKVWTYGIIILFIGASIIPNIVGEGSEYFYTLQDIPVSNGGINGSHTDIHTSNDVYEAIKEKTNNGNPNKRYSFLEHKWRFDITESYDSVDFYLEAYHTSNSEGDDFVFAYSTNNVSFTDLVTVTKTSDDDNYQSASLPDTLSGTVYIQVKDTDRTKGNKVLDTIYIDHMYIKATSGPDITPPVISDVTSSVNDDTWYKVDFEESGGVLTYREFIGLTYDSGADRTILFGGSPHGGLNDTWAYNYSTNMWVNRSPSFSGGTLSPRSTQACAELAYDSDMGRTILFGGYDGDTLYNDTWAYNYSTNMWVNRSPAVSSGSLTPRTGVMMAYYDSVDRMILFGGYDGSDPGLNETWAYNYSTNMWVNRSPSVSSGSLPRVLDGVIVYDSSADRIIMFGGYETATPDDYNETWVYCYSNNTWWKRNPSFEGGTLTPRRWHGMVYDSGADRTILFGGSTSPGMPDARCLNDTWVYNYSANTWYNVSFSVFGGSLYPREAFGMAYDSVSGRSVVACGFAESPVNFLNDTWLYNSDNPIATITWTTDEPSDSVVKYGTTTALGNTTSDSTMVTNHKIILTDLLPDTTYYYEVQSTDASNNTATDNNNGSYYTFYTGKDTTPPVISNVASSDITYNSAKITWDTDEPSNSKVNYDTTTPPTSTKSDSSMVTSHTITLTDLLPETTYYYEVQSTDQDSNTATDNNNESYYTFTTESEPNNIMHVYSIDMWYEQTGVNYEIYTKVKIVDNSDNPVSGATVYIETTLPGSSKISDNDVTSGDGTVTFTYGKTKDTGTYTSTVTNVVKTDWTYDPDSNVETSEQLTVP